VTINPDDLKRFDRLVAAAREVGQEPIEVLDRFGMLRREKGDGVEALKRAYHALEAHDYANVLRTFTGKGSGTPADMFRAVMLWFEAYITEKEKKSDGS
jgi:hypothetical protein